MNKSNLVRAFLVLMAISSTSTAAIYSGVTGPYTGATEIYAFKPLDIIFPGFVLPNSIKRPDGSRGFSGFVQEVRKAVQSNGGAPRSNRDRGASFVEDDTESQTADNSFETSVPIKVGENSRAGDTTEIYLGFSVKEILDPISPTETGNGEDTPNGVGRNRPRANISSSASVRGGSLSSGASWLGGSFFSTWDSGGATGFGFDLQPMSFSNNLGNGLSGIPRSTNTETSKALIKLRKIVLDLVFNPFVYFSLLIVFVFLFMLRFRASPA